LCKDNEKNNKHYNSAKKLFVFLKKIKEKKFFFFTFLNYFFEKIQPNE
jgi:hypothetical protein